MTAADTKGLEIPDCVIPLCINGKEFRLYATSGLSDTLVALAEEAVRLSVLTKDGNRSSVTVKFLERAIDGILGDGAVGGIFGEREPDICGLCGLTGWQGSEGMRNDERKHADICIHASRRRVVIHGYRHLFCPERQRCA